MTRDSDRSGEAGETCKGSTVGKSAGLQGIAMTPPLSSEYGIPTPRTVTGYGRLLRTGAFMLSHGTSFALPPFGFQSPIAGCV